MDVIDCVACGGSIFWDVVCSSWKCRDCGYVEEFDKTSDDLE